MQEAGSEEPVPLAVRDGGAEELEVAINGAAGRKRGAKRRTRTDLREERDHVDRDQDVCRRCPAEVDARRDPSHFGPLARALGREVGRTGACCGVDACRKVA